MLLSIFLPYVIQSQLNDPSLAEEEFSKNLSGTYFFVYLFFLILVLRIAYVNNKSESFLQLMVILLFVFLFPEIYLFVYLIRKITTS